MNPAPADKDTRGASDRRESAPDAPGQARPRQGATDGVPAGLYDRVYRHRRGMRSKWHHLKFERVRSAMGAPRRLLDIGCGPGTFLGTLGPETSGIGVDVAESQIAYARRHYAAPHRQFDPIDGFPLPLPDNDFDAVTCIEVIEHLARDQIDSVLLEARRVLRPGGTLVVSTPNYGGPWPIVEWFVNRLGDVSYEEQHVSPFTRETLEHTLRRAGFSDVRVTGYLFAAPFAAALHWRLADVIARMEPGGIVDRWGLLLLAVARPQ
jgi:ubiquinone/menaquinone biosynthesis C-methylase UbiE